MYDDSMENTRNSFLQLFSSEFLHVDTPSQNGVAETKNRHLLEVARALLLQMHVPKHFWADVKTTRTLLFQMHVPDPTTNP